MTRNDRFALLATTYCRIHRRYANDSGRKIAKLNKSTPLLGFIV
jgi:hypothetical protein